jgi:hypothetical protein
VSILSNHVAYKMLHFDAALTRDFRTALKWSRWWTAQISTDWMNEECAHFGISAGACLCGETRDLFSCYLTDISCSHRCSKGTQKPNILEDMMWCSTFGQALRWRDIRKLDAMEAPIWSETRRKWRDWRCWCLCTGRSRGFRMLKTKKRFGVRSKRDWTWVGGRCWRSHSQCTN